MYFKIECYKIYDKPFYKIDVETKDENGIAEKKSRYVTIHPNCTIKDVLTPIVEDLSSGY